ncbi:hypothetical protein F4779DRAFT_606297 [Xylariaceae sp. FL0662B]|nr:hypothetical protein F4779DRAFT_606297 [Xylariaceae sp. FL0662B]
MDPSFEHITPSIQLRRASKSSSTQPPGNLTTSNPSLIVLCTWVAAHPKHIIKYADKYLEDFPNADVLVIQTPLRSVLFSPSDKAQQRRLGPAIEIINRSTSSIFLHVYSNGGTVTVSQVLQALTPARREAIQLLVLDSCPGRATYRRTCKAVITSAPRNLKFVLRGVVYPVLLMPAALGKLGIENVISKARPRLNDTKLVRIKTPRWYVYSEADLMVSWKDAHDHAEEARQLGHQDVREVRFKNSGHCAHIMEDAEKYWGAIHDILRGF